MRKIIFCAIFRSWDRFSHMKASIKKYLGGKRYFDFPSLGLKTLFFMLHHRHASASFAEPRESSLSATAWLHFRSKK